MYDNNLYKLYNMNDHTKYDILEIVDVSNENINKITAKNKEKTKRTKTVQPSLKPFYNANVNEYEIGVDEVGRGPLFGRVYTAAVILPKDGSFDCSMVKDSKKFHSQKKIQEAANYIKEKAIAWYISFEDEKTIDEINILQATQSSMHKCILELIRNYNVELKNLGKEQQKDFNYTLLIDGNYFKPITYLNKKNGKIESYPYITVEGGDNTYASIASASILAKVERDKYIEELCKENPALSENYGIDSNKGYGAKRHLEGIKEHGITIWHRRSFGICKKYV
jgi:ribonuclease HII